MKVMKDEAHLAIIDILSAQYSLCNARQELTKLGAAADAEAIKALELRCEKLVADIKEKSK